MWTSTYASNPIPVRAISHFMPMSEVKKEPSQELHPWRRLTSVLRLVVVTVGSSYGSPMTIIAAEPGTVETNTRLRRGSDRAAAGAEFIRRNGFGLTCARGLG
jgi:hypothetical protein